jgi:hemoglobin/transferrin/lactoferrin receptor protein
MRYPILPTTLLTTLGLLPQIVYAHEDHNAITLDVLEITGGATQQDSFERRLDLEYTTRTQAQNLQDTFKLEPSIQVGTGSRNGQKVFMRGVEDLHLNIEVDGARQGTNNFHHQGRIQIDPFLLTKVEISPGPAAADAGPGALGGSVKFETVDAQNLLKVNQTVGVRLGTQYESASDLIGGVTSVYGLLGEHTGILAHVRSNSNNNVRAGGGEDVLSTDGTHQDYLFKASILDMGPHSLRISAKHSEDDGGALRANFPWQTNIGTVKGDDNQELYDTSQSIRYQYTSQDNAMLDIVLDVYNSETGLIRFLDTGDVNWFTEGYGGDLNNTSRLSTGEAYHALTYGIDYFHTQGNDDTVGNPLLTEHASNTGVYIQDRVDLGAVRLSGGLRYDRYKASYNDQYNNSGSELSPNLSGEWDLLTGDQTLTLFAGYGESIQGARLNQSGWIRKYSSDFELGENGVLKPEIAHQKELGAKWHNLNVITPGDHFGIDVTFYNNRIENYVITNGEGSAETDKIYNADGDVTSKGYEIRSHWGIDDLLLSLTYSHNKFRDYEGLPGDTTGSSARVGASTGDRLVLDGTWQWQPNLSFGYTLTAVERLTDVPDGRPEKPGYATHDVQMQWQPSFAKGDLKLIFAVENIFDKRYAEHTTVRTYDSGEEVASWEPGRNILLGAEWLF